MLSGRTGQPWAGKTNKGALRLDFNRRLMLRFHGSAITPDGGLLAYREMDEVLAPNTTEGEILRQSVVGRLAGYEDVNSSDCAAVRQWVVGGRAPMGLAASTSRMGRFETEWLTRPKKDGAHAIGDDSRSAP
jgi:hypothetical protein